MFCDPFTPASVRRIVHLHDWGVGEGKAARTRHSSPIGQTLNHEDAAAAAVRERCSNCTRTLHEKLSCRHLHLVLVELWPLLALR